MVIKSWPKHLLTPKCRSSWFRKRLKDSGASFRLFQLAELGGCKIEPIKTNWRYRYIVFNVEAKYSLGSSIKV